MSREQERNRLMELLEQAELAYMVDTSRHTITEYITDYLLNNGVVAPPVKVGDTVYEIFRRRCLRQRKVVEILIAEEPSFVVGGDIYSEERYHFSLFGKTVFLTRDDAEKALKERT